MKVENAPAGDVTEAEVHEACDYWYDLGVENPTPGLVKIRTRRGSNSTIGRYVATWVGRPKVDPGPMPQPLHDRGQRVLEAFWACASAAMHATSSAMVKAATDRAEAAERTLDLVKAAADDCARSLEQAETRAEVQSHRAQTLTGKLRAADAECRELRRRLTASTPAKKQKKTTKAARPQSDNDYVEA
ncbi:MAG: DNA-binding protein [Pseudolabrys sp.]|nr:DNA-binding protein [Pseudolabrys sp.]